MKRMPVQLTVTERLADEQKRRGAVLIVVLMLMILLLFLGITWFTFSGTEGASANYFADASRAPYSEVALDADVVFDFALEQLIIGTRRSQSVLWPGDYGLVPNMLGRLNSNFQPTDMHPFNGSGVNLISSANGDAVVDQNRDGIADGDQSLLDFLRAPCGSATGTALTQGQIDALPTPDVDYTAPDINNPWLSYAATVGGKQVVIPSFHRPAYLRDPTGVPYSDWETNAATARRVFRPHPSHKIAGTTTNRYLTATTSGVNAFPFNVNVNLNGTNGEQGIWSRTSPADTTNYIEEYDVDSTGNGKRDAVWMDLDFPKQTLADGRSYVPLMAMKVVDLDSLFNVNAHGNLPQQMDSAYPGGIDPALRMSLTQPIGNGKFLSASNQGLSTTEINPGWGLTADTTASGVPSYFASSATAMTALQQYRVNHGGNPANVIEAANFDLLNMKWGRGTYAVSGTYPSETYNRTNPTELLQGAWGENGSLYNYLSATSTTYTPRNPRLAPRPGLPAASTATQAAAITGDPGDDDRDRYTGRAMDDLNNWLYAEALLPGIISPSFVHPLDPSGRGTWLQSGTNGPVAVPQGDSTDPNNPSRWLMYRNYQGGIAYDSALSGTLNQTSTRYAWIDHGDEVVVDQRYRQNTDNVFGPEELFPMHASQTDVTNSGHASRLRKLMSLNFESNLQAEQIRQRFTTESNDRRQHNLFPSLRRPWEYNADVNGNRFGADNQPGRAGVDDDNNGTPDDASEIGWPGSDDRVEFPPVFVSTTGNATFTNSLSQVLSKEPFRAEVVAQLGTESNDLGQSILQRQLRLQLNRLCVLQDYTKSVLPFANQPPYNSVNRIPYTSETHLQITNSHYLRNQLNSTLLPRFRELTPHPALNQAGDNVAIPNTATFPPANATGQEYWARVDRQRMARDIYVLLYTLGGGQDGLAYDPSKGANYADGAGTNDDNAVNGGTGIRPLYTDAQLQVMAQFAVNYVDALDRDNVITKFEYDKNLGDGWGLGDNPYITADDDTAMPGADRGVVYGVEAQQLTFSEVIALISKKDNTMNLPCTTYDDMTLPPGNNNGHPFVFIELRNASPFPVSLSNGSWRIRRIPSSALAPAIQPLVERQLVLKNGTIGPGRQYTIGSQDGEDKFADPMSGTVIYRASDFRIDYDLTGTYKRIIPHVTDPSPPQAATTPTPQPACDLDLVHDRDQSGKFTLTDGAGTAVIRGGFMFNGTPTEPAPAQNDFFRLILERRVSLTRTAPVGSTQEADNPWIMVDMIDMQNGVVEFIPQAAAMDIQASLQNVRSTERAQPFDRASEARHDADAMTFLSNSIGQDTLNASNILGNSKTTTAFTRWQPHFDRDFASVIELLSLPLYGPHEVTANPDPITEPGITTSNLSPDGAKTAMSLFLRPQDPSNDGQPVASQNFAKNNRWYRLLDVLEVPRRMHHQLEQSLQPQLNAQGFTNLHRVPGLINVNTVRYPEVLGGLIDDSMITAGSTLTDSTEAGREWWTQFLRARDRVDPRTGLTLIGSPASRPFRSLSFTEDDASSVESTLLRRLTLDNEDVNRTGALEPGEDVDLSGTLTNAVGANEPRRLLEARTVSDVGTSPTHNTVDFAVRHRLLSKIHGNTTTRSNVFVVWITAGFFQAIEPTAGQVQIGAELAGSTRYRGFFVVDRSELEKAYNSQSRTFDFRKFILYRQTLQ